MAIVIKNSRRLILVLGIVFAFVSCDSNRVFDEYRALKKNSWSQADSIGLSFKLMIHFQEKTFTLISETIRITNSVISI